jgi:hypothetical protein
MSVHPVTTVTKEALSLKSAHWDISSIRPVEIQALTVRHVPQDHFAVNLDLQCQLDSVAQVISAPQGKIRLHQSGLLVLQASNAH